MPKNIYKISAIVPAYNEERGIGSILHTLAKSDNIDEIICINDGSTDNTLTLIKKVKKVILINLKKNHGKGYAIARGIQKATGQIVVFFDADIKGLDERAIVKLINPLKTKKYQATIGYPNYNHLDKLCKPISGERAYFKKDLVPLVKQLEKKGYGLELYLNYKFKDKKVKMFPLQGVIHLLKHEKQPFDMAAKMTLIEGFDILSEIIKQNNPASYIVKSYFYHFYLSKSSRIDSQINKLTNYIKRKLITKLF